jgi:hypothetical protein
MHEALYRPFGTTLGIVHAERRAADHSTNIGSKSQRPGKAGDTGTRIPIRAPARKLDFDRRDRDYPPEPVVADCGRSLGAYF